MDQFLEFATNNWVLVLLFFGILGAIIANELRLAATGVSGVEPSRATQLYNQDGALFVDIRGDADFRKGHLPGAMHVPQSSLSQPPTKLNKHKQRPVVVYDSNGMGSGKAAKQLREQGFEQIYQLKGGIEAWRGGGFPLESKR